jgi:sec-independent protein translocase protein TatA
MLCLEMNLLASFMNLGGPDLLVILLIILVLFGAKKLPELAKGLGQAIKEFQKAKDEFSDELHKAGPDTPKPTAPASTVAQNPTAQAQPDPNQTVNPGRQADKI